MLLLTTPFPQVYNADSYLKFYQLLSQQSSYQLVFIKSLKFLSVAFTTEFQSVACHYSFEIIIKCFKNKLPKSHISSNHWNCQRLLPKKRVPVHQIFEFVISCFQTEFQSIASVSTDLELLQQVQNQVSIGHI